MKPDTTMEELEAIAKAYFDDERDNADVYGRVGSGLIAAIKKAAELGVVTINKGLP